MAQAKGGPGVLDAEGVACCEVLVCGDSCGGKGCRGDCCSGGVRKKARSCDVYPPPCVVKQPQR